MRDDCAALAGFLSSSRLTVKHKCAGVPDTAPVRGSRRSECCNEHRARVFVDAPPPLRLVCPRSVCGIIVRAD
jgi:hypothetical protein